MATPATTLIFMLSAALFVGACEGLLAADFDEGRLVGNTCASGPCAGDAGEAGPSPLPPTSDAAAVGCASETGCDAGTRAETAGDAVAISPARTFHTCAVTRAGALKCWGSGESGRLGNGLTTTQRAPVQVIGLTSGVRAAGAGSGQTCALMIGGTVKCWGDGTQGELGNNKAGEDFSPGDVVGLTGVKAIAIGSFHGCALTEGGAVKCWGRGTEGQLGRNSIDKSFVPVEVTGLSSGVTAISAGDEHTCAVLGGAVKCWGEGVLTGGTGNALVPTDIPGITNADTIASGANHDCVRTTAGALQCWGANGMGQLGITTMTPYEATPAIAAGLSAGVTAVATGGLHSCALLGGMMQCVGYNGHGEIGNESKVTIATAAAVKGLDDAIALTAGMHHTCALTRAGSVKCWGRNHLGQLGDNTANEAIVPVSVVGFP